MGLRVARVRAGVGVVMRIVRVRVRRVRLIGKVSVIGPFSLFLFFLSF